MLLELLMESKQQPLTEEQLQQETLASLFSRAASQHLDNIAISYGSREITYKQLEQLSGQVAHALMESGLEKGDFVGLYMERSPETVISLLGVMRAGGVYVPIDPEHPIERVRYIVEDCSSRFILYKERYEESAVQLAGDSGQTKLLSLESAFAQAPAEFNNVPLQPDDLAYVIYTSGSTGKPKGTLIAHRGVVNLYHSMTRSLQLSSEDVVTQFSTFSFDASVVDTFEALLNGAHLALLTKEEQLTPELLVDLLERRGVTHIGCLPTSVFNRIAETTTPETKKKWKTVKTVLVAGEALLSEHVRKFQSKFGTEITIINGYGPTECTVLTTIYKVTEPWESTANTVPIGYPLDNYELYVVKEDGRLAEDGEEGELYIATPGLSRGYLNLPEKTNEVFITNPFRADKSSMLYKSGDIVRRLPEGSIEFQHRKDGQLKLRGFRIEIGEIENALSKHPHILDGAVVAVVEQSVVKHLSCFYTEKAPVSVKELKEHLKDYVPQYMIPAYFYRLDEIPLSPTGKVDRKKLLTMDNPEAAEMAEPFEAPVGKLETMLASLWAEVLQLPKVGRNVSFFDIGGDSLAVMAVLSHLKLDYLSLRMNDLYEHTTVEALAAYISTLNSEEEETEELINEYKDLEELPVLPKVQLLNQDGLGTEILLTGGTGYLGSHLLYELLEATDANIHVLVRPKAGESGLSRIQKTLDSYFGSSVFAAHQSRIFAMEGDLVQENLGLSDTDRSLIGSAITSIIHAGADVRHFGKSEEFQATNVSGTESLIDFVYDKPSIRFHFISTIGIPEDMAAAGVWEANNSSPEQFYDVKLESVYTHSKLLAEKVVADAIQRGLPCSIYRAGNLSCHSGTGHFQTNINENFFYRMIKAFLLLGKAPAVNTHIDITPVDFASRFMVKLMLRPLLGEIYHICNPDQQRYEMLIASLMEMGYDIDLLPQKQFERWVLTEGRSISEEAVQLAVALLEGDGVRTTPYRYSSEASFRKAEGLQRTPAMDELLRKLAGHAVERGYFPEARK
ncbi:non-ribosomal peptide synthetase [Paenibacillus physcomitrellae]|uniref:Peptide synthetase n=2 Tax=Paenibacillus physcomitrellae TaxID=1619311 RepID=A0ABQ1G6Q9_9BACL|nr:non-ribosomal peptide synthetase [Paenibacillus physcomitrellae]GGA37778.1 peptide synthetase [Paenibacillus physcomitrellae]